MTVVTAHKSFVVGEMMFVQAVVPLETTLLKHFKLLVKGVL